MNAEPRENISENGLEEDFETLLDQSMRTPVRFEPGVMFFPISLVKIFSSQWFHPFLKILMKLLHSPGVAIPLLKNVIKPAFRSVTRVHRKLGLDLSSFVPGIPMVFSSKIFEDIKVSGNAVVLPSGERSTVMPGGFGAVHRNGFLRSIADYEKYLEFDPDNPIN